MARREISTLCVTEIVTAGSEVFWAWWGRTTPGTDLEKKCYILQIEAPARTGGGSSAKGRKKPKKPYRPAEWLSGYDT